ncbi:MULTISPECIES: hypothetical protein [unclassified Streptomyces]|uniref:hypothetical protein n=1 Tax=unclassified Streptomyces TaxID=2593676 RepID=UPI00081E50B4|nr:MULTISPECIES: hypothetical protein [unclassified Streptomyces]MYZ35695.1 hypothetical protein [Streptomyces sp. SID4917]SCF77657.1 hypothetical protein GA0115259_1024020 [Streptomyces sp. MnatMP-M17]
MPSRYGCPVGPPSVAAREARPAGSAERRGRIPARAWAASWFVAGALFESAKAAVTAMDAAVKTGIGFTDAWLALRSLGLTETAVQGMVSRIVRKLNDGCKAVDTATFKTASFSVATFSAAGTNTGPGCWVGGLNGPGFWSAENEGMDAAAGGVSPPCPRSAPAGP